MRRDWGASLWAESAVELFTWLLSHLLSVPVWESRFLADSGKMTKLSAVEHVEGFTRGMAARFNELIHEGRHGQFVPLNTPTLPFRERFIPPADLKQPLIFCHVLFFYGLGSLCVVE